MIAFFEAHDASPSCVLDKTRVPPCPGNEQISLVFAKNIISYVGAQQQTLIPR